MKGLKCFLLVMLSAMAVSCNEYEYDTPRVPELDETITKVKPLEYVPLTRSQAEVADRQGEFGIEFFKAYAKYESDNILLSPFLMFGNLCAVSVGMGGEDYKNLVSMLGFGNEVQASKGKDITELYDKVDNSLADYFKTIRDGIANLDESTKLDYQSILFQTGGIDYLDSYIAQLKDSYGIDLFEGSEKQCQDWLSEHTFHQISSLDSKRIGVITGIANTLSFDSKWSNSVGEETRLFTDVNSISYERKYLTGKGSSMEDCYNHRPTCIKYGLFSPEGTSVLWLPYGNGAFSLGIILPPEGKDINQFIQGMTYDSFKKWYQKSQENHLLIYHIPTFTNEFQTQYCESAFEEMGYISFRGTTNLAKHQNRPEINDFSRAVSTDLDGERPMFQFEQGARISVSKTGTQVVSYTTSIGDISIAPNTDPNVFIADRPFVYAIVDVHGTILFMGTVTK